ncbi:hypothetical protein BJ322DRAFT_1082109 [Thelephora terrestris]|uniref:Uncharacterized protein n=1 Tax=Thelephora terrestris TaxID=56493 RepID=A0A9P6H721_9AGAM|nr:hypothetical protein BJ322DRAFT_1082109 [Thelephora terrestris]
MDLSWGSRYSCLWIALCSCMRPFLARFQKLSKVQSQELPFVPLYIALSSRIQSREKPDTDTARIITYRRTNLPQSNPRVQPHPEEVVL